MMSESQRIRGTIATVEGNASGETTIGILPYGGPRKCIYVNCSTAEGVRALTMLGRDVTIRARTQLQLSELELHDCPECARAKAVEATTGHHHKGAPVEHKGRAE